jgi:hypothetical protein
MIILAADPGNMTGWSSISLDDHWNADRVNAGQLDADVFCDWLFDVLSDVDLLIYETFTITSQTTRKSPQPVPIEVIGVMKFLARRRKVQIEGQSPGSAKQFVTDAQLRKLGLWKPGQDHARDAIRHLVLGIVSYTTGQAQQELLQSLA